MSESSHSEPGGLNSSVEQGFFLVPFSTLVVGTKLPIDLYSRIHDQCILVRAADSLIDEKERQPLEQLGEDHFLVKSEQRPFYIKYLEQQLAKLLNDPDVDDEQRVENCHAVGGMVAREVLQRPESDQAMEMAANVIATSLEILSQGDGSFTRFFHAMKEDADLYVHSLQVCFYGLGLAKAIDLDQDIDLRELGLALLFHDIGKLKLPAEVVDKPGPLTEEEWVKVRMHPLLGWHRIRYIEKFGKITRDVISNHHERLDGHGYPLGLSKSELSISAQLAGIANAFDARTTRRPYRPASDSCNALSDLLKDKGAYDRDLLATFVKLLAGVIG